MQYKLPERIRRRLPKYYVFVLTVVFMFSFCVINVYASNTTGTSGAADIWTKAHTLIVDTYNAIVGISTVLAALMSAIAVLGAKLSNNQHKVDQAWDWLRRIWIAWAIINGIGAFIAWVTPLFDGLHTLT